MTEFQKYIQRYLDLLAGSDLQTELLSSENQTLAIYKSLNDESSNFKYAADKWTLKEVLQHLIDCERIFQYRALAIARGDRNDLPGFDEEEYADKAGTEGRSLDELLDEYLIVRKSTILLFKSFTNAMLQNEGHANSNLISTKTIGRLIAGHNLHHLNVIKDRYSPALKS